MKFRGKRKDNGEWVYGDLVRSRENYYILTPTDFWRILDGYEIPANKMFEVHPESVGMSTGLEDKNGVEIYEGDKIINKWDNGLTSKGVVEFYEGMFIVRGDDGTYSPLRDETVYRPKDNKSEIIGNIHDNPELLETEE